MQDDIVRHVKAEQIRSVIRYMRKFKNAVVVIYLDDELIDSPLFPGHIRDICLIHATGLKVLLVPGSRHHIDSMLSDAGISWKIKDGSRLTDEQAMPIIKNAAFDVSNTVMTALAGEHITAVIGNWVRARAKGVLDGVDYGTAGEIDKLELESIRTVLENGFIPIFPCIGWSITGRPYNISSLQLAQQIAVHLKADKLFYILPHAEITKELFVIPETIGLSADGCVPSMNLEELEEFISANDGSGTDAGTNMPVPSAAAGDDDIKGRILSLLQLSEQACRNGVNRAHIINGTLDGSLPCEIFSDLGSGTMIYTNNYGGIRPMKQEDIPGVLRVMNPFVKKGILLQRTSRQLMQQLDDYIVYELDGGIRACAALHTYSGNQAEIAGVAVDETCAHIGIGPKIISYLIDRANSRKIASVFVLTTQTSDWFEKLGFVHDDISSLPEKRRELWTPVRNSKVFRIKLH